MDNAEKCTHETEQKLKEVLKYIYSSTFNRRDRISLEVRRLAFSVLCGCREDIYPLKLALSYSHAWSAGPLSVVLDSRAPQSTPLVKEFEEEFCRRIGIALAADKPAVPVKIHRVARRQETDDAVLSEIRRELYFFGCYGDIKRKFHASSGIMDSGIFQFKMNDRIKGNEFYLKWTYQVGHRWKTCRRTEKSFLKLFADYNRIAEEGGKTLLLDSDINYTCMQKRVMVVEEIGKPFSGEVLDKVKKFAERVKFVEALP